MKKYLLLSLMLAGTGYASMLEYQRCAQGYLSIETGYRYDRLDESNTFFDTTSPTFFLSAEQQFRNIQSYQLGARGQFEFPCSNFFVQGFGHYGWVGSGAYNYQVVATASIDGNTWDAGGSLGYFLPFYNCLSIAPLVGFSYDEQHFQTSHSQTSVPLSAAAVAESAHWVSSWYGPWVGFSLFFDSPCLPLFFDAGYEFHIGYARTSWHQEVTAPTQFSYQTHLNDLYGNVFHIQAQYPFCCHWLLGLRLQYTMWQNRSSATSRIPSPAPGLTATQYQSTTQLSWHSFGALVNLGFSF